MAAWTCASSVLIFCGIGFGQFVAFGIELVVDAFDVIEGLFLRGPVRGPDSLRAFEGHVFEHVCEAGAAFGIVDRAGVDVGVERDYGRFVAFKHDEVHAVGEREFGNALREFLQILGGQAGSKRKGEQESKRFHVSYTPILAAVRVSDRSGARRESEVTWLAWPGLPELT